MTVHILDYEGRLARLNSLLAEVARQVDAVRRENERIRANLLRSEFRAV